MLKPWYDYGCKRPTFSDEYLQAFRNPLVELIDTKGYGVEALTETGVVAAGTEYPVDCIVFATGFRGNSLVHEAGQFTLTGREGLEIQDKWRNGVQSVHGMMVNGFPNMFVLGGVVQAIASANFTHALMVQVDHMLRILKHNRELGVEQFEVTAEAEKRWATEVEKRVDEVSDWESECTPGYYNNEGQLSARQTRRSSAFSRGTRTFFEYVNLVERWVDESYDIDVEVRSKTARQETGDYAP